MIDRDFSALDTVASVITIAAVVCVWVAAVIVVLHFVVKYW